MARSTPVEDLGEPIPYDPDFIGPLKSRSCTDIICLFLFIVFIGCWVGVGIYAFTNGDPNTLLVPKDSLGRRCGLDISVENKPYLFFFDLTKCLRPTTVFTGCPTKQICVDRCPEKNFIWNTKMKGSQDFNDLICEDDVHPTMENADDLVNKGKCAKWYAQSSSFLNRCLYNIADRKKLKKDIVNGRNRLDDEVAVMKRRLHLIPMWMSLIVQNTIGVFTDNPKAQQVAQNIVDDLITSWWKILIGIGASVVICIIYIVLIRWIAAVMIWISLIGAILILTFTLVIPAHARTATPRADFTKNDEGSKEIGNTLSTKNSRKFSQIVSATYLCAKKYHDLKANPVDSDEISNILESYLTKKDTWLVLLIISSVVLGIILLIVIFLRKRILLAIALVKEGSKAVSSVTSVLFFPIFPWVLQVCVICYAIIVGMYLSTTGEPLYRIRNWDASCSCTDGTMYNEGKLCKPDVFQSCNVKCLNMTVSASVNCKFMAMDNPQYYPYVQAFNVFSFFWAVFFTSALSQMILASVFATWYWTFKKKNLPFFAVTDAIFTTLRYHIGTLAFGSLIIAICRMIRVCLEYIDQKLKKYDNELVKAILCCCKCFFWCLEKFLKFINRNAYIMCAIHGKNFCASAKDAFSLLMRNIIRVFVLDKVTDFLFFLGKLLITVGVGSLAYLVFATDITAIDNTGINYELVPVITIMICTYLVATIFFNVFSMAVDTLFLCFLEDCERNDGSAEKPYYMSKNLMNIFGKKNKTH